MAVKRWDGSQVQNGTATPRMTTQGPQDGGAGGWQSALAASGGGYNGGSMTGSSASGYQGINNQYNSADPFAYTGGSLLTPWTQEMPNLPTGGGPGGPNMDPFRYQDLGFNWTSTGDFAERPEFSMGPELAYGSYDPAQTFTHNQPVPQFNYNGPQVPGEFGYSQTPGPFSGTPDFQDPNVVDDPGYKFRQSEGLDALQNTAMGRGVRGGDVQQEILKYSQGLASQEYGNAWQRAMGKQQNQYQQHANTYNMNLAQNAQQFGQAAQAQQLNLGRQQQAWQQAAGGQELALAGQQQGWQQALAGAQFNEQNRGTAYDRNWQTTSGVYDRNMQNRMQTHQMNATNALDRYRANAGNNAQQGALQWSIAGGQYDRNRQNALDQWNSAYQIESARASAAQQNYAADYQRQMQQYGMAYGIFQDNQANQYNRLMGMAQLGMNANNQQMGAGNNYAGNYAQNTQGAANAYGAGQMAGAQAWGNAIGAAGSAVGQSALYGSQFGQSMFGQPQARPAYAPPSMGPVSRGLPSTMGGWDMNPQLWQG
jgi:hypothetical protein